MKPLGATLRVFLLLGWMFGILLPLASFRRFSPSYRAAFDWVFHTEASHVLMHTFLYAVLACLFAWLFCQSIRSPGRLVAIVLFAVAVVAALQETIQMIAEHVPLSSDELFDFFVDLNGGALGLLLFVKRFRRIHTTGTAS